MGILEKRRNWCYDMKVRNEDELELYRQSKFIVNNISSALVTGEGTYKVIEFMNELIKLYEEHLSFKEAAIRTDEAINDQDFAALNKQKQKLERTLDSVREKRIKDQRMIFQLESRITSLQSENTLTQVGHDDKTEQQAISAAEGILAKLQQKLSKHQEIAPLVDKLSRIVSKSKKRVINLDLAE